MRVVVIVGGGKASRISYDALKRLTSATAAPVSGSSPAAYVQSFQYDGFGNLTGKVLNGTTSSIPVDGATNRLTSATYDGNGNQLTGVSPNGLGVTYTYDEANRMRTSALVSGGAEYYGYGPDNKRIYRMRVNGTAITEEVTLYGAGGEKLGVYAVNGLNEDGSAHLNQVSGNVWFAGRLIWEGSGPVFQDRLGTNRAQQGAALYGAATVQRFYPYGEEIGTASANDREKFATYNRDGYTGLDYADQRYFASSYGRFNTADPYQASAGPGDPGSWNRYSYTGGDPVNRFDPSGRDWFSVAFYCAYGPHSDAWSCEYNISSGVDNDPGDYTDGSNSAGGQNPTSVKNVKHLSDPIFQKLGNALANTKCGDWLQSGLSKSSYSAGGDMKITIADFLNSTLPEITGQADFVGGSSYGFMGTTIPGTPPGYLIMMNNAGAFFKSLPAGGSVAISDDNTAAYESIKGGSDQAKAFLLIHELGHLFGMIRDDKNRKNQALNNDDIWNKCGHEIQSFSN